MTSRYHSERLMSGQAFTEGSKESARPLRALSLGNSDPTNLATFQPRADFIRNNIDGGGIRGISGLLILEDVMEKLRIAIELDVVPRPCDYFDLIGGTSTGG